ncbi:hypothetical protein [Thermoanaerobacterium sp. DL9XJH110]|uniref:hypothetical protein n=1 Tax=Thermoanaerobacterium sp. DL9XJH110 TaxID=3386643 RepID=UPI003BB5BE23
MLTARYICVGSPTLNNNIMPTVSAFLTYLKGLATGNKTGLAFGSYGWGGQSIDLVDQELKECKFETMEKIKVRYVPDDAVLAGITDKVKENL